MAMRKMALVVLCGLIVVALAGTVFAGSKKVKPEELTCEEFLAVSADAQDNIVYWIEGYSIGKDGTLTEGVVGMDKFDRPVAALVDECKKTPKESLWKKIKSKF